jgi:molecular chaperone GrpE
MTEKAKPTPEAEAGYNGAKTQQKSPAGGQAARAGEAEPLVPAGGEMEALRALLQEAEKARDGYLDLVKQTRADFENYQKRSARDLATERRYAQMPLAGDLLPALDNLERAIGAAEQSGDTGALVKGVALVQSQLLDVLRRHGVTRIDAQGKPFDPHMHQAVMQQPAADVPPQTVVHVLEPGYMFHERVLRPARVIVSMSPPD